MNFDYTTERRLWVRLLLRLKRALGHRMLFGETAVIAGAGPCQRCVGHSVQGAPDPRDDVDDVPAVYRPERV